MNPGRNFGSIHKGPATVYQLHWLYVSFSLTLAARRPPIFVANLLLQRTTQTQTTRRRTWMSWMGYEPTIPAFEGCLTVAASWVASSCACRDSSRRALALINTFVDSAATVSDIQVYSRYKCCCIYCLFNDVFRRVDDGWLKHNELDYLLGWNAFFSPSCVRPYEEVANSHMYTQRNSCGPFNLLF